MLPKMSVAVVMAVLVGFNMCVKANQKNWKNTCDLLTASTTRLKRVLKHIENTNNESWKANNNHAIAIIDDVKRDIKRGDSE